MSISQLVDEGPVDLAERPMASDIPADDWEAIETLTEQQERPAQYAQSASIDIASSGLKLPERWGLFECFCCTCARLVPYFQMQMPILRRRVPNSPANAGEAGTKERAGSSGRPGGSTPPEGIDEAVYDALLNQKTRSTGKLDSEVAACYCRAPQTGLFEVLLACSTAF